jgi:hypothetical protein
MNEKQIDSLLEKVRAELQQIDHVDQDERELLLNLEQDIHALLDRTGATPSILDRFQRAVEKFEIKYPTLTTLLSEVSTILSNAGI